MPQKRLRLIVGLGNPGSEYRDTRHNAGFMVLDELGQSFSITADKKKFDALYGRGSIEGTEAFLVKPMAYMNNSGPPVRRFADYFRISGEDMLIIHDDIDLAFGRLKIKEKGGHGGHKGVKSLMEAFGGGDFPRLRIGVGRSAEQSSVTDHVLGRYSVEELKSLDLIITRAGDAVVTILSKGVAEAMNRFNDRRFTIAS
jgi:PTH1 family peptidyl-tRNA hydrolase